MSFDIVLYSTRVKTSYPCLTNQRNYNLQSALVQRSKVLAGKWSVVFAMVDMEWPPLVAIAHGPHRDTKYY